MVFKGLGKHKSLESKNGVDYFAAKSTPFYLGSPGSTLGTVSGSPK
jgi:hypothetical protein